MMVRAFVKRHALKFTCWTGGRVTPPHDQICAAGLLGYKYRPYRNHVRPRLSQQHHRITTNRPTERSSSCPDLLRVEWTPREYGPMGIHTHMWQLIIALYKNRIVKVVVIQYWLWNRWCSSSSGQAILLTATKAAAVAIEKGSGCRVRGNGDIGRRHYLEVDIASDSDKIKWTEYKSKIVDPFALKQPRSKCV